ncbi:hypothetical protein [Streptomyces mirabilis]|uniref:hypothetical protein n=1 Tax=Streptomyces mirabilis TaxID=68239 RepID=UPI0036ADABD5
MSSATAPQLVIEIEFAGWVSGAGGPFRSENVAPAGIGDPVTVAVALVHPAAAS